MASRRVVGTLSGILAALVVSAIAVAPGGASGGPTAAKSTAPLAANGRIIFRALNGPGSYDIWTMNPDGSNMVDLLPDPNTDDRDPTFSPRSSFAARMQRTRTSTRRTRTAATRST